jgi:hypothetical protein
VIATRRRPAAPLGALALAALALGTSAVLATTPQTASAYGIATHAWLAEEAAHHLAAADPRFGFLVRDPVANACFRFGSFFPDMRSLVAQTSTMESLKAKVEGTVFVDRVRIDTTDVGTAFRGWNTHTCDFVLHLIEQARRTGDPDKLAFAYGNLAHVMQDKHAQVLHIPTHIQRGHTGDLGVEPAEDPAHTLGWYPGAECELVFEAMGDQVRPAATLDFMKHAPWRLDPDPNASYARAEALRAFYYDAVVSYHQGRGTTPPSRRAILNAAHLMEVSATLYPFITGHEELADVFRVFLDRYVRLSTLGALINGVAHSIVDNLTNGQTDLFTVVGEFIPIGAFGGQIGGSAPLTEIFFSVAQGATEEARVRQKYANNPEAQRLFQSDLLDHDLYRSTRYEVAHDFVVDGLVRGGASLLTDDVMWPRFERRVWRSAGIRSLLRASQQRDVAEAPELLVWDVRYRDAGTGQEVAELVTSRDAGKALRVEAELFGTSPEAPIARLVRVRLRADTGAGAADPILGEQTRLIPAVDLDPRRYGSRQRPVVTADWTVAAVSGAQGVYVEVDEVRVRPDRTSDVADRLFTTQLDALAPLMQGRPHYAQHYDTSNAQLGSLRVRP